MNVNQKVNSQMRDTLQMNENMKQQQSVFTQGLAKNLHLLRKQLEKTQDQTRDRSRSRLLLKKEKMVSPEIQSTKIDNDMTQIMVDIEFLTQKIEKLEKENMKLIMSYGKQKKFITLQEKEINSLKTQLIFFQRYQATDAQDQLQNKLTSDQMLENFQMKKEIDSLKDKIRTRDRTVDKLNKTMISQQKELSQQRSINLSQSRSISMTNPDQSKKINLLQKNLKQSLFMNRELNRINKLLENKLKQFDGGEEMLTSEDFAIRTPKFRMDKETLKDNKEQINFL